jgi:hypothetical protein
LYVLTFSEEMVETLPLASVAVRLDGAIQMSRSEEAVGRMAICRPSNSALAPLSVIVPGAAEASLALEELVVG